MAKGETYGAFVDKFKPKKTTDDCYTPTVVYDAVADWVAGEYGLNREHFMRPFWPGSDYKTQSVPEGWTVVDNPPFSIISQIVRFYIEAGTRFFLFAPTLTLFSGHERRACYIPCGVQITYENGAKVNTSFVTNLDPCQLRTVPALYKAVRAADAVNVHETVRELPKYSYPSHVLTAVAAYQFSHSGIDFSVMPEECVFIRAMDAQREAGKGVFGSGLLLSERAAAERAAAERAAALAWPLSQRERAIIATLSGKRGSFWAWFWFVDEEREVRGHA